MAKKYRRPLITFYLKDIPPANKLLADFRTLSETVDEVDVGLSDAVVRDILARQILIKGCLEEIGDAEKLIFIDSKKQVDGVASIVSSIKKELRFSLDAFRSEKDPKEAFTYFRTLTENAGIFVILVDNLGNHHSTINVEVFRGFAFADETAPFIAINANDSPSAWSFTLAHELAHLWLGNCGVSGGKPRRNIEKFCNDVASELLLPNHELRYLEIDQRSPLQSAMDQIREFSKERKVSNTLVAYKLYREGSLSFEKYQKFQTVFREFFINQRRKEREHRAGGGPSYYKIRKHRLGKNLLRFVEQMMHEGNLTPTKASKVLGINANKVYTLFEQANSNQSI